MGGAAFFITGMPAIPDVEFCGRGRIRVTRKGRYHPVYTLTLNGEEIAQLEWHGPRRIRYTTVMGDRFDLRVGQMKRKIRCVEQDGKLSKLVIPSNRNYTRRDLNLRMCNGDDFIVRRRSKDRWGATRLEIRKRHYLNSVLVFHFDQNDPSSAILIDVEKLMRWEMAHFHRLLALVTARIGLERRNGWRW